MTQVFWPPLGWGCSRGGFDAARHAARPSDDCRYWLADGRLRSGLRSVPVTEQQGADLQRAEGAKWRRQRHPIDCPAAGPNHGSCTGRPDLRSGSRSRPRNDRRRGVGCRRRGGGRCCQQPAALHRRSGARLKWAMTLLRSSSKKKAAAIARGGPFRPKPGSGRRGGYSSLCSLSVWARLRAAPRMSPRLAPESDEPNSAIAFFSSSSSRALIDSTTRRRPCRCW